VPLSADVAALEGRELALNNFSSLGKCSAGDFQTPQPVTGHCADEAGYCAAMTLPLVIPARQILPSGRDRRFVGRFERLIKSTQSIPRETFEFLAETKGHLTSINGVRLIRQFCRGGKFRSGHGREQRKFANRFGRVRIRRVGKSLERSAPELL